MKRTITLTEIDPISIYGAANRNLEALCGHFPHLKTVARGSDILLEGKEEDIEEFELRLQQLIEIKRHKMHLTPYDVEEMFDGETAGTPVMLNPEAPIVYGNDGKPIIARNGTQKRMVSSWFDNDLIFATGPAGTGKTYIAIALAVRALKNRDIKRIILTRPAVEAGERLGFFPGDLKDKLDPYLQPLYDALGDMIPSKKLQDFMAEGTIQIAPLAYMRGRTLDNAFIILDEAQNTTPAQMKMFLTRIGFGSKVIITGDASQKDLPKDAASGLDVAMKVLKKIPDIGFCQLTSKDVVRHPLVQQIVQAYEDYEKKQTAPKSAPRSRKR